MTFFIDFIKFLQLLYETVQLFIYAIVISSKVTKAKFHDEATVKNPQSDHIKIIHIKPEF